MDEPIAYHRDEIVPIPAKCKRCGFDWVDKDRDAPSTLLSQGFKSLYQPLGKPPVTGRLCRDAIRAPSLDGCRCFWCGGKLTPHPDYPPVIDAKTRRTNADRQLTLFEVP